jgi:hypothetical protein
MTELQAQPQGNMPGIQLYGSRCNPYTFPITRIPRPLFLDNLHSRQNSTFTRERFQAWASGNRQIDNPPINNKHATNRIMPADNTVSSTALLAKPGKPFVAAAAFPDDIPRLVEVEFAAFQDEIVNHVLSYRDSTNPEHTARTIDFYKHCMQHIRTSTLPEHLFSRTHMRTDSKLDLALNSINDQGDKTIEGYRFRKVIDPNTNEIIAFCKTEITTLTPEDHASPLDIGHETEPQMNRDWFALNERLHRQYCGLRQHLCKLLLPPTPPSKFCVFEKTTCHHETSIKPRPLTIHPQTSAC